MDRPDLVSTLLSRIRFEADTMIETGLRVEQAQGANDQPGWVAYMESSLIHARGIIDFLYKKESTRHEHDMRPSNLVPGWDPDSALEGLRLREASDTISRSIVHLSWLAHEKEPQSYEFDRLAYRVVEGLRRLADHADTQHHHALCVVVGEIEEHLAQLDHELVLGP